MDDIVAQLPHDLTNEWLRELRFLSLEIHINKVISMPELIYIRFEEIKFLLENARNVIIVSLF